MSFRDPGTELENTELSLTSTGGCGVIASVQQSRRVVECRKRRLLFCEESEGKQFLLVKKNIFSQALFVMISMSMHEPFECQVSTIISEHRSADGSEKSNMRHFGFLLE